MVNDLTASASLATAGKTPTLRISQREEHTSMDPILRARTSRWYIARVHILFVTLHCALHYQSWHIVFTKQGYCVAIAFFLGFFKRFKPFTLVFSKLEYAVLKVSTSRCSTTVEIFLLFDCARTKHLYSGFITTGFPSRGSGFVRPSSGNREERVYIV